MKTGESQNRENKCRANYTSKYFFCRKNKAYDGRGAPKWQDFDVSQNVQKGMGFLNQFCSMAEHPQMFALWRSCRGLLDCQVKRWWRGPCQIIGKDFIGDKMTGGTHCEIETLSSPGVWDSFWHRCNLGIPKMSLLAPSTTDKYHFKAT